MEFGILGELEVVDAGERLDLGGLRPRALVALLLLHANEVVSVDRLVEELWGAEAPASVSNTLQQTVSRLRRALGPDRIETRSPGYLIRVAQGELDLERFEELVARGDADSLREALALWRGEPLADFAYEPFAQGAIARLTELRLEALERRIDADLARETPAGLVGEIDALVAQHPLRERLRGLQMIALYRAGRQAEALAAYREARRLLADELGLDPSEELQRLEKQILTHDPALEPPAAAVEPPPAGMEPPATPAEALVEARKLVTILFCDVVADEHADPETLRGHQARSSKLVTAAVERHGGTIVSSAGGEVTAVFGVPAVREDDAVRTIRTAVEIREALPAVGLQARIGAQSGEVIVDGSGDVAGIAVAVAKRLANAAAAGEVLIGGMTLALTARAVDVEQAEPLPLGGRTAPLGAFRVLRVHEIMEPVQRMHFVGRGHEVALIRDAWRGVTDGRACELVTVVGDAGIGKSRLTAEALAPLDALILRGRCLPYGDGITYWPVIEVLNQLEPAPLAEAAAPIRALLGETEAVTSADEIAGAFRKTLEHAAARQPLIVVFDDIHWGEDPFLDLVEHVALLSAGAPILLLCVARPELLEHRPSWPAAVRLDPLADTAVDELIPGRISSPLREKIARAAAGNPLFIEEMLAIAGDADDDLVVPPTLQAVLAARLDQLDPDERAVLSYGAVEGEAFHHGAIQALAPPETHVAAHLAGLVRKGLIRPDQTDLVGEDGFRFRHLLIRDAAYDALPKATRAVLHERFAVWLESHGAQLVSVDELLGHHLEQSCRYHEALGSIDDNVRELAARAARHLRSAGLRAVDRGDVSAASNLFGRAIALLPADSRERLELMSRYEHALHASGRVLESRAIGHELYERATALGESSLAALAHGQRTVGSLLDNPAVDVDRVRAILEELLETFTELGDEVGLARAKWELGIVCAVQGRLAEAGEWLERALAHANAAGDQATRLSVTQTLAMNLCQGPRPVGDAILRCEELRAANRDDRVLEAVVMRCLSALLAMAGRFDEARECGRSSSRVLDEANILISSWVTRGIAAQAKEFAGDRVGAERDLEARWLYFRDTFAGKPHLHGMQSAYRLANLYCDDGRWDDAEECLAFYRDGPGPNHVRTAPYRLAVEARVAGHRGRHAEAVRLAQRGVELVDLTDDLNAKARVWLALAEVERARGAKAEADAAVATALDLYEQKGNIAAAGRLRAAAHDAA